MCDDLLRVVPLGHGSGDMLGTLHIILYHYTYKGRCTDVFYSRTEGQYLFHVVYDSDSDDEDYELWEIAKYST